MKMTPKLKAWLVSEKFVADKDSSEESFLKAATEALISGKLSSEKLVELQTEDEEKNANDAMTLLKGIAAGVEQNASDIKAMKETPAAPPAAPAEKRGELKADSPKLDDGIKAAFAESADDSVTPEKSGSDIQIRLKGVEESFDSTKQVMRFPEKTNGGSPHAKAGQIVMEGNRIIEEASQLERALSGMWFKCLLQSSTGGRGVPHKLRMNDQDKALLEYALHKEKWGGKINSTDEENGVEIDGKHLSDMMRKQVVDDLTSGGLEIAPIAFDNQVITFPLLHGELFPKVNLQTITRGRRIEGATVATVTMAWGGGDDTAITLQLTAGFVGAFDTLIHVIDGAIEIGLDFLSDASVDIGPIVTDGYGRRLMNQLDRVIGTGDGTTQPEGVTVASGTTAVASANGASGPPTVGDYEGLLFGVPKEYKSGHPQNASCFCANETTYARARGIAVGSTDERRVFGMSHEDYQMFSRPFAIENSLTNPDIFFGVMARYRMYRRMGLTMRSSTEGTTLIRRNMLLITARARFGGQVEDGSAFAVMSDAQS